MNILNVFKPSGVFLSLNGGMELVVRHRLSLHWFLCLALPKSLGLERPDAPPQRTTGEHPEERLEP